MSTTIYGHTGTNTTSVATNHSATQLIGPPAHGGEGYRGIYIRQTASATAPVYRWMEDLPCAPGQASPTTFTAY